MNKEPFLLYIFRLLIGCAIALFLFMLYWSSALLEQDMQSLKTEVEELRDDINKISNKMNQIGDFSAHAPISPSTQAAAALSVTKSRPHIDEKLPNLLDEDPFYDKTLPKLLGPHFKPYGVLETGTIGKYDNLLPFPEWGEVSDWSDWCNVAVAQQLFGKYETLAPDMAIKMEERRNEKGAVEYWIHLRDNVFWQPLRKDFFPPGFELDEHFLKKYQVTANDFKFYFDAAMNPYMSSSGAVALRPYLEDIEEFRIVDSLTFVVRWKQKKFIVDGKPEYKTKYVAKLLTGGLRPLASFVYQYYQNGKKIVEDDSHPDTYRTNAIWAQGFSQHWARNIIVSCGRWIFDGKSDRQVDFKRNRDFYSPLANLLERREVLIKESGDNIWQDFKANKLTAVGIEPGQMLEFQNFLKSAQYMKQSEEQGKIRTLEYYARMFAYIGWNQQRPFFKSAKVRQALTMAIDRQRIIKQFINGMGIEITGPIFPFSKAYDQTIQPWPYDVQRARRLLEEEGWYDHNGDGIIDKEIDGKLVPFRFTINYLSRSNNAKNVVEFIATSLKEIGIDCRVNGIDVPDISAIMNDRNFDALMLAWSLGSPPDDPRQIWYTNKGDEKGSSNYISFSNAEVDRIIDELDYEFDKDKRIALYHHFQRILHEEAPYVFLYCPKVILAYREKLQNVFIPLDRQDLIPGADWSEPDSNIYWIKQ